MHALRGDGVVDEGVVAGEVHERVGHGRERGAEALAHLGLVGVPALGEREEEGGDEPDGGAHVARHSELPPDAGASEDLARGVADGVGG